MSYLNSICYPFEPTSSITCPTAPERLAPQPAGLGTRLHSAPCLLECAARGGKQKIRKQHSDPVVMPSAGPITIRALHSSPRLSELMQRGPLPTILGSPSRVRLCVFVCMCVCVQFQFLWVFLRSGKDLILSSPFRPSLPLSSPNLLVLPTW